jgi:hypothetical protein
MTPWESIYAIPEYGRPSQGTPAQWHMFQNDPTFSVPEWADACGVGGPLLEPWRTDALGMTANLGPFAAPLRERPDVLARMRVWVMRHDTEPHEAAIPLGISGLSLASPRMAALGTHLERFWKGTGDPQRTLPYSAAITMSSLDVATNGAAATAVGLHRGAFRPLSIRLGRELRLTEQLPRPGSAGFRSELDELLKYYDAQYRQLLADPRHGTLKARALSELSGARRSLESHDLLAQLLTEDLLTSKEVKMCIDHPVMDTPGGLLLDETSTAMRLATHMLTAEAEAARYVQVVDAGIFTDPAGQGFDSHGAHVGQQGTNCLHSFRNLMENINRPGENDPKKLDLDKDFVLVNTEFGRAPTPEFTVRNPYGYGTDHWPWGYVIFGFGAFADEERSGIVGAIGPDAFAAPGSNPSDPNWITPTEHRAAMLLAHGVWPFTDESFASGDIRDGMGEDEAAAFLLERVLGYSAS